MKVPKEEKCLRKYNCPHGGASKGASGIYPYSESSKAGRCPCGGHHKVSSRHQEPERGHLISRQGRDGRGDKVEGRRGRP